MRFKIRHLVWFGSLFLVYFWLNSTFFKINDCSLGKIEDKSAARAPETAAAFDMYGHRVEQAASSHDSNSSHQQVQEKRSQYYYNHNMPLVFIGGVQGAGLTLMRAIVDAHPDIRCGEDTNLITNIVLRRQEWTGSKIEKERLFHAGMHDPVINSAVRAFILELIVKQGKTAKILCNKDPMLLMHAPYTKELFPHAKFIWLVRDARANAHRLVSTGTTIAGYQSNTYESALQSWNKISEQMYAKCHEVGPSSCLMVRYEQLVLEPERITKQITAFLNVTWSEQMLHHEKYLDGITLSNVKVEESLNTKDLYTWLNKLQSFIQSQIEKLAPMMAKLGYDTFNMPPNYQSMFSRDQEQAATAVKHNASHPL